MTSDELKKLAAELARLCYNPAALYTLEALAEHILSILARYVPVSEECGDETERMLRREWWLNHGCSLATAYGDDGEMQCHGVDFKRMPLDALCRVVTARRYVRATQPPTTPKGSEGE